VEIASPPASALAVQIESNMEDNQASRDLVEDLLTGEVLTVSESGRFTVDGEVVFMKEESSRSIKTDENLMKESFSNDTPVNVENIEAPVNVENREAFKEVGNAGDMAVDISIESVLENSKLDININIKPEPSLTPLPPPRSKQTDIGSFYVPPPLRKPNPEKTRTSASANVTKESKHVVNSNEATAKLHVPTKYVPDMSKPLLSQPSPKTLRKIIDDELASNETNSSQQKPVHKLFDVKKEPVGPLKTSSRNSLEDLQEDLLVYMKTEQGSLHIQSLISASLEEAEHLLKTLLKKPQCMLQLVTNPRSSQVIQKLVSLLPSPLLTPLHDLILHNLSSIATNPAGCYVVQSFLQYCSAQDAKTIVKELLEPTRFMALAKD
jgi:hypothetical protein